MLRNKNLSFSKLNIHIQLAYDNDYKIITNDENYPMYLDNIAKMKYNNM